MYDPSRTRLPARPSFIGGEWAARHLYVSSLLLGGIAALGFPPLRWWPVALLAMGAFVLLLRTSDRPRKAFTAGWLFGVGHYTITNNWIAMAFTYQDAMPPILGWIAVPLLALYLGVYPGLAALAVHRLAGQSRPAVFALMFGASWIVAEWLKSWVFTGYAWGPFSLALLGPFDRPGLAGILPFIGTYALSGLAIVIGAMSALLLAERRWRLFGLTAILLTIGMYLPFFGGSPEGLLPVTIVQPDVRQDDLDNPALFETQFRNVAKLSQTYRPDRRRLVLWPESGIPDYLEDGYPQRYYDQMTAAADPEFARFRIGRAIGPNSLLLTGAVNLKIGEPEGIPRAVGAYNGVTAMDGSGTIRAGYRKAHLVPYGEYLALRWLFEPLGATRLVAGTLDFIPGPGPQTLDLDDWGRAGVQICYEIIFSGQVVDRADRPDYIFNPSNDGWFGAWGPPQHLAQARMRAIEEGLPVLRATTTGISAIVDAQGIVRAYLPMHLAGRIDAVVPPAAAPTPFALAGHWLTAAWVLILAAASAIVMRRGRR